MKNKYYKITLKLKEQYRTNGQWYLSLNKQLKIVPSNTVCFYSDDLITALQSFSSEDVTGFIIEYNYEDINIK